MGIELFRTIISENQEYIGDIHLVKRPVALEENGNYVFASVRQAGDCAIWSSRQAPHAALPR